MDKQAILQLINANPRLSQAVDVMEEKLASMNISPEMLQEVIGTLEYVLQNPQAYPQVRAAAIQRGFIREQDMPAEFSEPFLVVLLGAMYELQERLGRRAAFARGGLAQLAQQGRGGDTMLAHINSREAEVLRRMGGSGTINPNTGIVEFKGGGLGDIVAIAAPIILDVVAPGAGTALSGALGGGALGAIGAGALMGGATSLISGGDPLKGALSGALGGGLGGVLGEGIGTIAGDAFGTSMSKGVTDALGSGLVGGLGSLARGEGFGKGLVAGGLGALIGQGVATLDGEGPWMDGLRQAGGTFGNALAAGYTPQQALAGAAVSGLARGMQGGAPSAGARPMGAEQDQFATPADGGAGRMVSEFAPGETAINTETGDIYMPGGAASAAPGASAAAPGGFKFGLREAIALTPVAASLLSMAETPEQAQQQLRQAGAGVSPQQQEYFNRAAQQWDWNRIAQQARAQNMGLGKYIASNWNALTSANNPYMTTAAPQVRMARGGLNAVAALAQGDGSGRDDTIDARLSDGEYVFDAESVALLGDGSTQEGARRLDAMRTKLRKHKGKALSSGKFSPDAKSPLTYLKEAA